MTSVGAPDLPGAAARNRRDWMPVLGRVGLVAKGASYALVAFLALQVALGEGGRATSRSGALATIAGHSWGKLLLVAMAIGFAAYALWRLAETIWPPGDDGSWKQSAKRLGTLGRAAIYAGLTYSALKIAFGSGGQESQNAKAHHATAQVLSWQNGRWIVGVAGAVVIVVGLYNAYRGLGKKFTKRWDTSQMSATVRRWSERIGLVGLLARSVVFCLIGAFVIKAALEYDPREAIGLDGALQKLANQTYGSWLLGFTAAGLLMYAAFCLMEARYREL
jgi:hypothetical protein